MVRTEQSRLCAVRGSALLQLDPTQRAPGELARQRARFMEESNNLNGSFQINVNLRNKQRMGRGAHQKHVVHDDALDRKKRA